MTWWPWPWSLTYFSKTLILAITFKPEELGLSYCICAFLVIRPLTSFHNFWRSDLNLEIWPTFQKTLILVITYEPWETGLPYFTCIFLVTTHFTSFNYFLPWPWSLTYFSKTLTLVITYEPWEIGLSYFTCVFLVTRHFTSFHNCWCSDLDLEVWPTFKKL